MIRPPLISALFPYTTLFRSLFPKFAVADHAKWEQVVKKAREGDGAALTAVGHVGDADKHLICVEVLDRKSTRLNSSHLVISYAVFCLKKKRRMTRVVELHIA